MQLPPPARRRFPAARAVRFFIATAVLGSGVWQLSLWARLWAGRVRYPWDIEWLESSYLYEAYRIGHGLSTFGPPRDGYLPLTHPPGGMLALALAGRVFGLDYATARTLAFGYVVAATLLVGRGLVRRCDGAPRGYVLAVFAAGSVAASAPIIDGFHDLARSDGIAILLCVLLATLAGGESPRLTNRRVAAGALLLTAIVYTRIPAVFFGVWVVLFVFARHRASGVRLAVTATALGGLVLVALQLASKGWFWMLTIAFLGGQTVNVPRFREAASLVLGFAPFLPVVGVVAGILAWKRRLSSASALWLGMLVAAVPASFLPFAKVGGFSNDLLPVLFMVGPAAAFVAADLLAALEARPRSKLAAEITLGVGAALLLGTRTWSPSKKLLPSAAVFAKARALNATVAALDGDVIAPRHPFLPILNGKTTLQWSEMAYLDMLWSGYQDLALGGYIDRIHARWALLGGNELTNTTRELSVRYQLDRRLDAPVTLIGDMSSMRYLFRWNDDEAGGHVLFDFESLDGWLVQGEAFALTTPNPGWEWPIQGAVGRHLANSYHRARRDPAKGSMISPEFVIDRGHISLRVGGGNRSATRAELRVDGRPVRVATGVFQEQETLTRVVWDVSELRGQRARLALVDEDDGPWGHLLCDHVVAY